MELVYQSVEQIQGIERISICYLQQAVRRNTQRIVVR